MIKDKIIKLFGGYTEKEINKLKQDNTSKEMFLSLAVKNNDFYFDIYDLTNYFYGVLTTKKEIKYSAHTTRKHPIKDKWMYPKYSRPLHEYLKYDDKITEYLYQDIAKEYINKYPQLKGMTGDDIIYFMQFILLRDFKPADNYVKDIVEHGKVEVWESPLYLYDNLYLGKGKGDCDSWMLFFHNILSEILMELSNYDLDRLYCCVVEYPDGTRHAINIWLKGDDPKLGVGIIPLETTMTNTFKKDWLDNKFLTKQKLKIIYCFNSIGEREWN